MKSGRFDHETVFSTLDKITNFLKIDEYKENGIPVGAVNIDSMWATQFNNFVVNTDKFYNPQENYSCN